MNGLDARGGPCSPAAGVWRRRGAPPGEWRPPRAFAVVVRRRPGPRLVPRAEEGAAAGSQALPDRGVAVAREARHEPLQPLVLTELSPTRPPLVVRIGGGGGTGSSNAGNGGAIEAVPAGPAPAAAPGLLAGLRSLYLPEGFPATVTDDYLPYQMVSVPTHVLGWLSHSLATSSLLKAVGIQAGPVGAVAASAAIKWIIKDGIGAAGRFLVGGRLGREFDDDPRRWRMVAEAITTLGLALEISTSLYPQHFLVLASSGNFAKALAKGMGKPVFRVVQTHFAASGNVGAVAAKEEVWEVSAQLAGYAASVAVLSALEDAGSWLPVLGLWAAVQGAHVALRYYALSQLRFATLNQKRACALAAAHVAAVEAAEAAGRHGNGNASEGGANVVPLPGVAEINAREPMLAPATSLRPRVRLGCSLQQVAAALRAESSSAGADGAVSGGAPLGGADPAAVAAWVELYGDNPYLLAHANGVSWVAVKPGATTRDLLGAVWQAAWLDRSLGGSEGVANLATLRASAEAARRHGLGFTASMTAAGWDLGAPPVLQVQPARVEVQRAPAAGAPPVPRDRGSL